MDHPRLGRRRLLLTLLVALGVALAQSTAPYAVAGTRGTSVKLDDDGPSAGLGSSHVRVSASRRLVLHLRRASTGRPASRRGTLQYRSVVCSGSVPSGLRVGCVSALGSCMVSQVGYAGVPTVVWSRRRGAGQWSAGPQVVCSPESAPPGVVVPPAPSMGQVVSAFRSVSFAKPGVRVEPPGLKTLVYLPTYYEVVWSPEGLAPGEVSAPVTLLGWKVEFQIEDPQYNVRFGDGQSSGWTARRGGRYPDGDIVHSYTGAGVMSVKADARLRGKFRIDGGPWRDIDGVADLDDGPVAQLRVLEAKPRLVDD